MAATGEPPPDASSEAATTPEPAAESASPGEPAANGLDAPGTRASDAERDRVADLLTEHAGAGRLTLAEMEERVGLAYAARTRAELSALTRDLPLPGRPAANRRPVSRWFVAILGGSTKRGSRRMSGTVNSVAILGGDDLDLREAEIDGGELTINVFSILGGANVYLPDTVEVEVSGFALLGGDDERGSRRQPRPGAPLIRVRSYAVLGGVDIWRLPARTRGLSLRQARRVAKALESGADGPEAG